LDCYLAEGRSKVLSVLRSPKSKFDNLIRERAYQLWEKANCPAGEQKKFWFEAQSQICD
jgi:hypothetical protein